MATAGSPQAAIRSQQPTQGGQTPGQARPPVTAAPATASGQTSLEDSKINLKLIRGHAIKELTEILMMAGGKERNKVMVFDPTIAGPLGLVVEIALLKELGVDSFYYLAPGGINHPAKHYIYIVRPEVRWMRAIASHIKAHKSVGGEKKNYHVYFVPRRSMMCERVLEDEGVWTDVRIGEYHLDLIPFDSDLLSLELSSSFKDIAVDGDRTSLFYVAKSLMKLQHLFGIIPNIQGKGSNSLFIAEMMFRMRREMSSEEPLIVPEIDRLILIDREVDLITPCLSQLTYEGMIDEVFGIYNSTVDLPAEMVLDPKANEGKMVEGKKIKTYLNSNDSIFSELRDSNFSVVGPKLQGKAQEIESTYAERHSAKSVQEIKEFMNKLQSIQAAHQFLRIHTNIAERVLALTRDPNFRKRLETEQTLLATLDPNMCMAFIEEAINKQEPIFLVLRLLCLYSLTYNGVPEKVYNFVRREILQTYGFRYLFVLEKLNKLGMFKPQTRGGNWERLRNDLQLVLEEVDEKNPTDIAYVYSGYAPLSCRLVEQALSVPIPFVQKEYTRVLKPSGSADPDILDGWSNPIDGTLDAIPGGPAFHAIQSLPKGLSNDDKPSKMTLVMFVGGCTFTEISACRFISHVRPEDDILVGTTKIMNGNSLIESLFDKFGEKEEYATGSSVTPTS